MRSTAGRSTVSTSRSSCSGVLRQLARSSAARGSWPRSHRRTPDRSLFNSVYADRARTRSRRPSTSSTGSIRGRASGPGRCGCPTTTAGALRCSPIAATSSTLRRGRWASTSAACARPASLSLTTSSSSPERSSVLGAINDRAYEIEDPAWGVAMEHAPGIPHETLLGLVDGEPVAGAMVLDHGGDAAVSAVATLPEHRGKGLAGWIVTELLRSAARPGPRDREPAGQPGGSAGLRAHRVHGCRVHRALGAARGVMPDSTVWT